jgi:hypothetical protein
VIGDVVVVDLDAVAGEDRDAGAGRHQADDVAGGREVGRVVVDDLVVVDARARAVVDLQAGQREHQEAAGVGGGEVAVDVGSRGVLDLDAGDVLARDVVAHDDVVGLADVDAGVRRAAHRGVLDEDVRALHRVHAVGAVGRVGAVGPLDADAARGHAGRALPLERVARRVLEAEVLDHRGVAGDEQALGARRGRERQDRAVFPAAGAGQADVVDREAEIAIDHVATGAEADGVSRLRVDERGLDVGGGGVQRDHRAVLAHPVARIVVAVVAAAERADGERDPQHRG